MDESLLLRRTSTADKVASSLRTLIVRGDYSPGTPIREATLASSMGVSRNTVREGIQQLISEGLLSHKVHKGVVVATPSERDIREIFEIRRQVERYVLLHCDESVGRDLLARLNQDVAEATENGDVLHLVDADLRFHQNLVDSRGNGRLSGLFAIALGELRLALFFVDSTAEVSWIDNHRRVCELLSQGKHHQAARLLDKHLLGTEKDLLRRVKSRHVV
jgi:DNA-binding GntR family transcriptional regulator